MIYCSLQSSAIDLKIACLDQIEMKQFFNVLNKDFIPSVLNNDFLRLVSTHLYNRVGFSIFGPVHHGIPPQKKKNQIKIGISFVVKSGISPSPFNMFRMSKRGTKIILFYFLFDYTYTFDVLFCAYR